jgi:magnesium transporter
VIKVRHYDTAGSMREISVDDLAQAMDGEGMVWIDMDQPTDEEFDTVAKYFEWHPLAIEDCRNENHLPKVDDYQDHILLVLHAIAVVPESAEFTSREIEIFLGANYLVTHHSEPAEATVQLEARCESNPGLAAKGPAFLLYLLLETMSNVFLPYLDELDERIEGIEEELLDRPTRKTVEKIYQSRRDVIRMRRVVSPQLEVMRRLGRAEFGAIPEAARPYFNDIFDDLFRVTQAADSHRELLSGALDSYLSALSNEMNQVMKVLTIFASIMLPLTFLAGVWGMNFRFMPELDEIWGYPFALALMAITAGALIWFFRRRNWM